MSKRNDDTPVFFTLKDLPKYVELIGYFAGYRDVEFKGLSAVDFEAIERRGEFHDALPVRVPPCREGL